MGTRSALNKAAKETVTGLSGLANDIVTQDDANTLSAVNTFSAAPLYTGVQRHAVDAILTIADTTNLLIFAHATGGNRVITMPAATKGRYLKILWEIEQATTNRVLTCAGSDDFTGQINCSVQGDGAGDGDVLSVTDGTVAITLVDDINIGSELNCYCGVAGAWIVTGHITYDAVGSVPTIA